MKVKNKILRELTNEIDQIAGIANVESTQNLEQEQLASGQ